MLKTEEIYQDKSGYFCDVKKTSKYYLNCLSYVPREQKVFLNSLIKKKEPLTDNERRALAEGEYLENLQKIFSNVCNNTATEEEILTASEFIENYSLETLVKRLLPKEFDSLYTFFKSHSLNETKHLTSSFRNVFGNSAKNLVMTTYLNYLMDDKKIRIDMMNVKPEKMIRKNIGK